MTDARLPVEWLGSMVYDDLDDRRWRVFSLGLMWCNAQGTDGRIPRRYLVRLHPEGATPADAAALVAAGLWEVTDDGWVYPGWAGPLRQSTAAEVAAYKEAGRQRAANSRARALGLPEPYPKPPKKPSQSNDVANATANVRPNAPANVGEASRPASASASAAVAGGPVVPDSYDDWYVAPIGQELHEGLEVL